MFKVLFICVHNAGRSQMAEAIFNRLAAGRYTATSAGSQPSERVNMTVAEAMQEIGYDISKNVPKKLTDAMGMEADLAVTMGCGDLCPVVAADMRDWALDDPAGKSPLEVRKIRDEIFRLVKGLVAELDGYGGKLPKA